MEDKNVEVDELSEKILFGMKEALRKLIQTSAVNNEDMVIGDENGNMQIVPAKDLLNKLD